MRIAVLMAALASAATAVQAAPDLMAPLAGHPGVTAFDLAKLVVTDLAVGDQGATGHAVVRFRHIEGKDQLAPPGDSVTIGDDAVEVRAIPGVTDRVLALIDLGPSEGNVEEAQVLGLFALTPKPRLLDLVEVGDDRWTGMADTLPLLAAGAPLIEIDSGHSDASVSFQDTDLVFVRGDRFQLIDTLFTHSESACAFQHTQQPSYRTAPASGPYRAVIVSVRDETTLSHVDCGEDQGHPKAGVRIYAGTYAWDAARRRFVTRSTQLKALAALNARWLTDGE